jgi:hypothetical protein
MGADEGSLVARIEAEAARRFVRWDGALWARVLDGPGRTLAEGFERSAAPDTEAAAILESYLRLASHGIGLGYLVPSEAAGAQSFFTLAWTRLLPALLPGLDPGEQAHLLAACWNVGENLASSPPWLQRIFARVAGGLEDLRALPLLVEQVSRQAIEPPGRALSADARAVWVHLGEDDRRFLPGPMHFLAPTVVCVHDRHRGADAGSAAASTGIWLADAPLVLGPMGCRETPRKDAGSSVDAPWGRMAASDPRFSTLYSTVANEWRAVAALVTSQFVVALVPPPDASP